MKSRKVFSCAASARRRARLCPSDLRLRRRICDGRRRRNSGQSLARRRRMLHKKNTFRDFIACAETLLAQGYGRRRTGHRGRHPGGLLMGRSRTCARICFKAAHRPFPLWTSSTPMMDASLPLTVGEYEEWGIRISSRIRVHETIVRTRIWSVRSIRRSWSKPLSRKPGDLLSRPSTWPGCATPEDRLETRSC